MWPGLVWLRIGTGGKSSSALTTGGLSSSAQLHRVSYAKDNKYIQKTLEA
jgi:hypothetical protein